MTYVPGWDCHGLPIELKVLQGMKSKERQALTPVTLRERAAGFAVETMAKQRESFKRYGVWGEWDAPYLTLQPEYEAAQIDVFGQMALKGYIYRGLKPVHWSPSSRTALAEVTPPPSLPPPSLPSLLASFSSLPTWPPTPSPTRAHSAGGGV